MNEQLKAVLEAATETSAQEVDMAALADILLEASSEDRLEAISELTKSARALRVDEGMAGVALNYPDASEWLRRANDGEWYAFRIDRKFHYTPSPTREGQRETTISVKVHVIQLGSSARAWLDGVQEVAEEKRVD